MKIIKTCCNYEVEPLAAPFGFKGGYVNENWQIAAYAENAAGKAGLGVGTQGVLWSDAAVFEKLGNDEANLAMFKMTKRAMELLENEEFDTPETALDFLLPKVYAYGCGLTGIDTMRMTFALNALVAADNALWQLYANESGVKDFDALIPENYRGALQARQEKLAVIPLVSYKVSEDEINALVGEGYFLFKIKIGSDPDGDRDQEKMLEWDKKRVSRIHSILKDKKTDYSESGRVPYYLDANGRYENKERLMRLLDHCDKIGALERIIILEEPFPEDYLEPVFDVPVRVAADESAHTDGDALSRIGLGYGAIALKPIAKTLSMSLKILKAAANKNIPCFCADLTVNPVVLEWNRNFAARLTAYPGMKIGMLESNGHQNYKEWDKMTGYHPRPDAGWVKIKNGAFELGGGFYESGGGLFETSAHYKELAVK